MYHLDPNDVPAHLRGDYTGRKFRAEAMPPCLFLIPADAGQWREGSRYSYQLVRLADGEACNAVPGSYVQIRPGFVVVCHSIYRGEDVGLTFHAHPDDIAPLLPAPAVELTPMSGSF